MHATPNTRGPLDRLPAGARHLLLAVLPLVLTWIGTDVVPAFDGRPVLAGALAVLVQVVTLWATAATRQYGAGSAPTADEGQEDEDQADEQIEGD